MEPDTDQSSGVISEHLDAIAEDLGYEVIGPWLYKHANDIKKWRDLAAESNSEIWEGAPAPISMFIMLADVNRRCYEYLPREQPNTRQPEQPKTWHLQPFQKARENALKHVRIFWEQGVIEGAVRSLHGQCVPDMFKCTEVVYKDQDILQGNRANIMAPWWLDDPDRRTQPSQTDPEYCDFLLGLYSPVRNAFTAGDLGRLMGARNHVALRMLYDSLVQDNLKDIKTKLKETLAKRGRPLDWATLAILLYEHKFLQILGCEVTDDNGKEEPQFLVCPHYFRWNVTLGLPKKLGAQSNGALSNDWHPITSSDTQCLKYDYDQGSLILRYSAGTVPIQASSAKQEVGKILKLSPFEAQQLERQLQYACYGPSLGDDQLPKQYSQLLALARRPEVKSLTIVRTTAPPSGKPFPIYPAELSVGLCEQFNPNLSTPSNSNAEILVHIEAYCDKEGNPKRWIREARAWVQGKAPADAVPPVKVESHTLTLYLETDRNLGHPTIWRLTEQCLKDHAMDVLNNTFHSDAEINAAIAFYTRHDWSHSGFDDKKDEYHRALKWLNIQQAHTDGLKALFMNHDDTAPKTIGHLSKGQIKLSPREVSKDLVMAACNRLAIELEIPSDIQSVAFRVVPGIAFLVALRNVMKELKIFRGALSMGSRPGVRLWTLRLQGVPAELASRLGAEEPRRRPGGTQTALAAIKRCKTTGLRQIKGTSVELDNVKRRVRYFRGTRDPIITVTGSDKGLDLTWETGA